MATEKTLEILKELKADPKAKELLDSMKKPNSPEEMVSAITEIAEKLGYDLSETELKETILEMDSKRKARTEAAKQEMEALEDDDLENVAGGNVEGEFDDDECEGNHVDTDCWLVDACAVFVVIYFDCDEEYY